MSTDYLRTLDVGTHDIKIVSKNNTPSGTFTVAAPKINIKGFYYNQPYVAYARALGGWVALFFREDNSVEFVFIDGKTEVASYTADGKSLTVQTAGGIFTGTASEDGMSIYVNELTTTFTLGHEYLTADDDYAYLFDEELNGYKAYVINKTKSSYGAVKTGINGYDTLELIDDAFSYSAIVTMPELPETITKISRATFSNCDNLQNIDIPSQITLLDDFAFYHCDSLVEVTIPNTITEVGYSIFQDCTALKTAVLGNGLNNLGSNLFSGCTSLQSVQLSEGLSSIGHNSFSLCSSLTSIKIPNSVTTIEDSAFSSSGLVNINLGNNVTTIGNYAFYSCKITDITIPSSVTSIGYSTFNNCINLVNVTIPSSLSVINPDSFRDCSSLTNIIYTGTIEQWNKAVTRSQWIGVPADFVQCSDGQVRIYH